MAKKRRGRPPKARPKPLGDEEDPPLPKLKAKRIQYVKEFAVSRITGHVADLVNDELNEPAGGGSIEVKAIYPLNLNGHTATHPGDRRVLVVFERDDRRKRDRPHTPERRRGKPDDD